MLTKRVGCVCLSTKARGLCAVSSAAVETPLRFRFSVAGKSAPPPPPGCCKAPGERSTPALWRAARRVPKSGARPECSPGGGPPPWGPGAGAPRDGTRSRHLCSSLYPPGESFVFTVWGPLKRVRIQVGSSRHRKVSHFLAAGAADQIPVYN